MDFLDAVSTREDAVLQMRPREGPTPLQQYCKLLQGIVKLLMFSYCGHGCQQIAVGAGSEQDAPNRRPYISPHSFKHTSDNYRRPTGINADNAGHITH